MKAYIKPLIILLPIVVLVTYYLYSLSNRSEFSDVDIEKKEETIKAYESFSLDKLADWRGKSLPVGEYKEPILIMHFWASWCEPCIHEFPDLIKMAKNLNGKVQVFAISEDKDKKEIESFIKSFKEAETTDNFHIIWDQGHDLMNKWSVTKLPESYIYGPSRKLVKHVGGVVNWTSQDTSDYFKAIETQNQSKDEAKEKNRED